MTPTLIAPPSAPKKSKATLIVIIIVVVVVGLIGVASVVVTMGIYGFRRYLSNSKTVEGQVNVMGLAKGVATCATERRNVSPHARSTTLPATARPVPASLALVRGTKYQSTTADWSDDAYRCAHFDLVTPQYFQYQWVANGPNAGVARAVADLDGDGTPEVLFESAVNCASDGRCEASAFKMIDAR